MSPAHRDIDDLWKGRRFKLYSSKDEFREGKVVSWTQWNTGPFCLTTFWKIHVEMESFGLGDTVIVEGLQSAKQLNGKEGRIIKFLQDRDRYKVKLLHDSSFAAVKPENIKATTTEYSVNRMNIEGGGTLTITGERKKLLISLEWLEPAVPAIDLDEGALKANCPTCRAVEPPIAAYDEAPSDKEEECPICLEIKPCRVLQCGHDVCNNCWRKWRQNTSGIPVSRPQIDPEQLKIERDERSQEVSEIMASSSQEAGHVINRLLENLEYGDEGLSQFWRELMAASLTLLCNDSVVRFLREQLSIPALEIMLLVLEERADEINDIPHGMTKDEFFAVTTAAYFDRIGELYEEVGNYRAAIPWYERALMCARRNYELLPQEGADFLGAQHCNLGLAQKYAGFLSKALENYDASLLANGDNADVAENRDTLLREMQQWTGTSGKLTPGC